MTVEGGNHCSANTPPTHPPAVSDTDRQSPLPSSLVTFVSLLRGRPLTESPLAETWLAPWRRSDRTPGNSSRICPDPVNPSRCWPAEEMLRVRSLCQVVPLSDTLNWPPWTPLAGKMTECFSVQPSWGFFIDSGDVCLLFCPSFGGLITEKDPTKCIKEEREKRRVRKSVRQWKWSVTSNLNRFTRSPAASAVTRLHGLAPRNTLCWEEIPSFFVAVWGLEPQLISCAASDPTERRRGYAITCLTYTRLPSPPLVKWSPQYFFTHARADPSSWPTIPLTCQERPGKAACISTSARSMKRLHQMLFGASSKSLSW